LELANERGIVMPIVAQVQMVLNGTMAPKDLGPHLATEDDVPRPELRFLASQPGRWQRLVTKLKGK
jgi:glycerol-3-phosphate dehydrogenase (NAD(P)+)